MFMDCLWLLLCPQGLKCLLSGPFQRTFANSWSKTILIIVICLHTYIVSPFLSIYIDARKEPWVVDLCKPPEVGELQQEACCNSLFRFHSLSYSITYEQGNHTFHFAWNSPGLHLLFRFVIIIDNITYYYYNIIVIDGCFLLLITSPSLNDKLYGCSSSESCHLEGQWKQRQNSQ